MSTEMNTRSTWEHVGSRLGVFAVYNERSARIAYNKGQRAYAAGVHSSDNLYATGTQLARAWLSGWLSAAEPRKGIPDEH